MKDLFNWKSSLVETYQEFASHIWEYAPRALGALLLLLAGWVIAFIVSFIIKKIFLGFEGLLKKGEKAKSRSDKFKRSYTMVAARFVYWLIIFFFIAASGNLMGWRMFTGWFSQMMDHLPNLLSGILVIFVSVLLGEWGKNGVRSAVHFSSYHQRNFLGRILQFVIIFIGVVIGVEQIGIEVHFLTELLVVAVGCFVAGLALAFGLGSKDLISNVVASQNLRKYCKIGDMVEIEGERGELLEITQSFAVVETASGRSLIPAQKFLSSTSRIFHRQDLEEPPEEVRNN